MKKWHFLRNIFLSAVCLLSDIICNFLQITTKKQIDSDLTS